MRKISVAAGTLLVAFAMLPLAVLAQDSTKGAARPEMPLPYGKIETAIPAAREVLLQIAPLVDEHTYRELGFTSPDEVKSAQVGTPLPVFTVQLDDLRAYTSKVRPESLLRATNEAIFPVEVEGQVRTGIKLRHEEGNWRFSSFGASAVTRAVDRTAKIVRTRAKVETTVPFVVSVPVFHLYFIGHRGAEGAIVLTPTTGDSRFKFQTDRSVPAAVIFDELAPYARKYKAGDHLVD